MMTTDELISKIKEQINSGNRGASDYLIVDKIEELIDEYEKSGGCEKCNDHSEPKRMTGRWANSDEYVKHVEEITGHEQHITYHDDSVYCSQCWSRRNGNWDYCPYCGSYNGGENDGWQEKIIEEIDFAIKVSNLYDSYTIGFKNGLRYAKYLIDGKVPVFENDPEEGHERKRP